MDTPKQIKPKETTPQTETPKDSVSLTIPTLKPRNQRGETPKSQGIYFLHKEEIKTDEDKTEMEGYNLIPKIKEAVGSNNLKAYTVIALTQYYKLLVGKGLIKVEETKKD